MMKRKEAELDQFSEAAPIPPSYQEATRSHPQQQAPELANAHHLNTLMVVPVVAGGSGRRESRDNPEGKKKKKKKSSKKGNSDGSSGGAGVLPSATILVTSESGSIELTPLTPTNMSGTLRSDNSKSVASDDGPKSASDGEDDQLSRANSNDNMRLSAAARKRKGKEVVRVDVDFVESGTLQGGLQPPKDQ